MTTSEAVEWANGGWRSSPYAKFMAGVGTGIDVDGLYGFQCKDFANGYAEFVGTPFGAGNAINLWVKSQPHWNKVDHPQAGDVFVRNAVFDGVNYGDTGIVVEVTTTGVHVIQQNLVASLTHGSPPASNFWSFGQLLGYLRSNNIEEENMASTADLPTVRRGFLGYWTPEQVAAAAAEKGQSVDDWLQGWVGTESNSFVQALADSPQFLAKRQHYEALEAGATPNTTVLKPGNYEVK